MEKKVWITVKASDTAILRSRAFLAHEDGPITDQKMRDMYVRCVQDMIKSRDIVSVVSTNHLLKDDYINDYHFALSSEIQHKDIPYVLRFTDASKTGWINTGTWPKVSQA